MRARSLRWAPLIAALVCGMNALGSAGIASAERLPKFGEYVYVEVLPEAAHREAPVYPERARASGVQGTVLVQALIGRDGLVRSTKVIRSIPELDAAATTAVLRWRFRPARADGRPVAVWVALPVKFTLH